MMYSFSLHGSQKSPVSVQIFSNGSTKDGVKEANNEFSAAFASACSIAACYNDIDLLLQTAYCCRLLTRFSGLMPNPTE